MKISQFLKEIDRINVNSSTVSYAELDKSWDSDNMLEASKATAKQLRMPCPLLKRTYRLI